MNTDIFLIRHGQPVLQEALLGSTDSPLSELGWQQLEATLNSIQSLDCLLSSSLSRCAAFAQHYAEKQMMNLQISDSWRECHFGDWDGKTYQSLYQQYPQAVSDFFINPDKNTPPNGESLIDFSQRIERTINLLLEQYAGKRIGVITHAGVIRTIVAWCLKMDYTSGVQFRRFAVGYASITHISVYHGDRLFPQLINLNQTSQLASMPVQAAEVVHV